MQTDSPKNHRNRKIVEYFMTGKGDPGQHKTL